jgi:hypothetical protein
MTAEKHVEKKFSTSVDLLSGGAGAALSKTMLAPIQRVVVLKQLGEHKGKSNLQLIQHIAKEGDGIKAFFRGNLISCLQRFPYSGIQLVVYGKLKHFFQDLAGLNDGHSNAESLTAKFIMKAGAGGIAATVSGTIIYPADVVRTRIMSGNPKYRGIRTTCSAIWQETPWNFYRGLGASLTQRVPDILINFAVYESLRYYMEELGYRKNVCVFSGSAAAAVTAVAVSFPLDVIKRRLALAGSGKDTRIHNGILALGRTILREDGIRGLYAGAGTECIRCVPQVALMWFSIEYFREFFDKVLSK